MKIEIDILLVNSLLHVTVFLGELFSSESFHYLNSCLFTNASHCYIFT